MARKKKKKDSKRNEIVGIIVVGFAAFLAITVYLNIDSLFGNFVKSFIFGVFGVLGYIVPILLAIVGVLIIIARAKTTNPGKLTLLALAVFFVFSIVHLSVIRSIYVDGGSYASFITSSYDVGAADMSGGGVLGALLTYWTYAATGFAGSVIICIIGIVACIIALTNLSLKQVGKQIGYVVKTSYDEYKQRADEKREQKRLYIENLELEEDEVREKEAEEQFDMKIQSFDNSMNELYEKMHVEEEDEYAEEYDPQQYRKVFSDTDIQFDDEAKPEAKGRRRIDIPAAANNIQDIDKSRQTKPIPTVSKRDKKGASKYVKPPLNLLTQPTKSTKNHAADLKRNVEILESTLESFNVNAKVVNVSHGPVVTRYEVQPAPGVKVSKIVNLADDIAMNLSARDVRIEAPVPGKPVVGIEIPNNKTSSVGLRELLSSEKFRDAKSAITFALGKDIAGSNVYADISKMPHLLIAGATGSGKSVCINSLIISILYHSGPEDVRMIMIDPKVVELNAFNNIPHLLVPVVTDPKKAASAINWAVKEMTMRYRMFANIGAKDLAKYNEVITAEGEEKLPQILVIIDELADLMMVAPGEVEDAICRIAQLGRASGIHLVIATQRPSVDVITGIIKANIPSRIAFAVSSQIDSRTILDMPGAEKLLGQGDMLYYPTGMPKPVRLQGCYISDKEVEAVTTFLKAEVKPNYDARVVEDIAKEAATPIAGQDEKDELFVKALELILEYDQASTSMLQRRLRIGYARAARLIDQMEEHGYITPADGSKPRQVLITREQLNTLVGEDME